MPTQTSSGAMSEPSLDFFEGFEWAVPTAFSGALASYRFEQGDVIHRARSAYEPGEASDASGMALQILSPPRSARGASPESDGDRKRSTFESEVKLLVVDQNTGQQRALTTTQGRLLMTLWRGELDWIEGRESPPSLPYGARELAGQLEALKPAFETIFVQQRPHRKPLEGCLFLFVVDLASDASRIKAEGIREALAFVDGATALDLTPVRLGLEQAESFHPSLVVRGFVLPGAREEDVVQALRGALYGGRRSDVPSEQQRSEEGTADRFSVARHGLLTSLRA